MSTGELDGDAMLLTHEEKQEKPAGLGVVEHDFSPRGRLGLHSEF